MIHMRENRDLSTAEAQLEHAVELVLEASTVLLKAGRRAQVSRLEEIIGLLQAEVEQLHQGPVTDRDGDTE